MFQCVGSWAGKDGGSLLAQLGG